jgi:NADPH2 dehydrogenase
MISDGGLGIWDDKHIEGLQRNVSAEHAQGAKVAIKLAHGGGKAIVEREIFAPSAIPFDTRTKRTVRDQ